MAAPVLSIALLGRQHAVVLPSLADREDLAAAWLKARKRGGGAVLRVNAAVLGLCTRLGRESEADFGASGCDVLVYGGAVYSWLRSQGVTPAALVEVAQPALMACLESLAPREEEVKAKEDFSEAGGAGTT